MLTMDLKSVLNAKAVVYHVTSFLSLTRGDLFLSSDAVVVTNYIRHALHAPLLLS